MSSSTNYDLLSRRGALPRLGVAVLAAALAACDTNNLTQLDDPDIITVPVASDTANLNELANGVQFELARALTGVATNNDTPGIYGLTGVFTDELWYASTFNTVQDIDARNILSTTNTDVTRVFLRLQRTRNLGERVLEQYAAVGRPNSVAAATVANTIGYMYIFLAENFCNGVPISSTTLSGELTFGAPQTTTALLDSAIVRFNSAITRAGSGTAGADQVNLARVGLGRALLAQGKFAEAAAAVASVPSTFVYQVQFSTNSSGQQNGLQYSMSGERRTSAATSEGVNGLPFFRRGPSPAPKTTPSPNTIDPRVPVDSIARGSGTNVPVYAQLKYPLLSSPVVLANGDEARLIQAEALLNKGASDAYLPILNEIRSRANVTPALTDPGTADGRVRQFFSERAFNLWLTGHRLADLRRMVRVYGYTQEQVFPTGQTIFGAPYGSEVNFPIPFQESNNPESNGGKCIDRNA